MKPNEQSPFLTLGLSESTAMHCEAIQSKPAELNKSGSDLEPGETVVWSGRPNMNTSRRRAIALATILALCFLIVPATVKLIWPVGGLIVLVVYGAVYGFFVYKLLTADLKTLLKVNPKKEAGDTWGEIVLASVVLGACLINVLYQRHQLDLYHASPGCVEGYKTDPNLSPCAWVTMHLDGKWENSHPKGGTDYGFNLTDSSGMQHSVQLPPRGVYRSAKEGDSVQAKIWRGSIVVLSDRGVTSATMDGPGITALTILYILVSGPLLGVVLFHALCQLPKR